MRIADMTLFTSCCVFQLTFLFLRLPQHGPKPCPQLPMSFQKRTLMACSEQLWKSFETISRPNTSQKASVLFCLSVRQGMYATTVMMASAMSAHGASIQLWFQKPSPLALLAIHVANPQKGKHRLRNAMLFASCPAQLVAIKVLGQRYC